MKLTIAVSNSDKIYNVEVSEDMSLLDFKAYIESESDFPVKSQRFSADGKDILDDAKSLNSYNVRDGDLLLLSVIPSETPAATSSAHPAAGAANNRAMTNNLLQNFIKSFNASKRKFYESDGKIEEVRNLILGNPYLKTLFPESNDVLVNAPIFRNWLKECIPDINNAFGASKQNELEPKFLEDVLKFLQQRKIDENMRTAMEYSPESFGSVTMLYVDMEVNDHKFKAFVDSGAQKTIMSPRLAERCGLSNLIDRRFQGEARGVGKSQILGQIHQAYMKLNGNFFPCSMTVLDTSVDFLLGLDMLKRHRGVIDLRNNKLILGDTEANFLPEHECPNMVPTSDGGSMVTSSFGGNIFSPENGNAPKKAKVDTNKVAQAALSRLSSANARSTAASSSNTHPEASIQKLVGLGFSREQAIKALDQSGGNEDFAASILFQ